MTTTVHTAMKDNSRRAFRGVALALSLIVYLAGLVYAGVRSYDLFARTLPAELLPLALLGIVALELTALGLPLAIHYWTAPGSQRLAAVGFYALDLTLIIGNSILDAAQNSGTVLPGFMSAYGTFAVPALPVVCMVGWALVWMLDPTSREHDMTAAVRSATFEAMLAQVIEEAKSTDIGDDVRAAAAQRAREIVSETLGKPRRPALAAPPALMTTKHGYNAEAPESGDIVPEIVERAAEPVTANGTRRRAKAEAGAGPK